MGRLSKVGYLTLFILLTLFNAGWCRNDLSSLQRTRIEDITHVFEGGSIAAPYGSIENLNDGRGYTAGRDGFCTATGDLLQVILSYNKLAPRNILEPYTAVLDDLARRQSDDISELRGFTEAWHIASDDTQFIESQDRVSEELYFCPSIKFAQALGLNLAISKGQIYDTIIQHGNGDDPDSLGAIAAETSRRLGGSPASEKGYGVSEITWLRAFMQVRLEILNHAHDPATREAWRESIDRVNFYLRLLENSRQWSLSKPVHVQVFGYDVYTP